MSMSPATVEVREVALDDTVELRTRVLRRHLPGREARAASDGLATSWHLGAFRDDTLLGVVTAFPQEAPSHPGVAAQRFRFMAVEPAEQGTGVGTALMAEVIERSRARGNRVLWAHGRDSALDFYCRLGFRVIGAEFLESELPHHTVVLEL